MSHRAKRKKPSDKSEGFECRLYPERGSNPHNRNGHRILSPARLPVPPSGPVKKKSGRRDSDPRPQPWQGCALPTELLPHRLPLSACDCVCKYISNFLSTNIFQRFFRFFFEGLPTSKPCQYYNPAIFLISFNLFNASMGVRLFKSSPTTSSLILLNTGSSSWKKLN